VINKLAIGTVQFGLDYGISNQNGITAPSEVANILATAQKAGINTLDTARAYGTSEAVLGRHDIDAFQVVSKTSITVDKAVSMELSQTLDNLQLSTIYAYLVHNGSDLLTMPEKWHELQQLKARGSIEKIGYSLYYPKDLDQLLDQGLIPDLIQVPYSLLDRRFETYFNLLKEQQVEIHTRSTFLQGLMFIDYRQLPDFFAPVSGLLKTLHDQYESPEQKAGYLLRFCLGNANIDKVVIGVNNTQQLKENIFSLQSNEQMRPLSLEQKIPEEILIPSNWPKYN
jgi:aryl-alcohol dehydrogenase-like predicted oxidoreductase